MTESAWVLHYGKLFPSTYLTWLLFIINRPYFNLNISNHFSVKIYNAILHMISNVLRKFCMEFSCCCNARKYVWYFERKRRFVPLSKIRKTTVSHSQYHCISRLHSFRRVLFSIFSNCKSNNPLVFSKAVPFRHPTPLFPVSLNSCYCWYTGSNFSYTNRQGLLQENSSRIFMSRWKQNLRLSSQCSCRSVVTCYWGAKYFWHSHIKYGVSVTDAPSDIQ